MDLSDEIAIEAMKAMLKQALDKELTTIEAANRQVEFIQEFMPVNAYKIADNMIKAKEAECHVTSK